MSSAPNDPKPRQNMALNLKRQGKFDQAVSHMEVVLDMEPANDICLYNLGITFNLQSNYDKAE